MTIFENDFIKVDTTGKNSASIAVIENKTNQKIYLHYDELGATDSYEPILIEPNDWVGLLANDESYDWIEAIRRYQIYVATDNSPIGEYPTGCSLTQWKEDCKEITAEVERILNEYNLYDHNRNTNVANSNQLVTVLEILKKIK